MKLLHINTTNVLTKTNNLLNIIKRFVEAIAIFKRDNTYIDSFNYLFDVTF